jgi:hypothetical protein
MKLHTLEYYGCRPCAKSNVCSCKPTPSCSQFIVGKSHFKFIVTEFLLRNFLLQPRVFSVFTSSGADINISAVLDVLVSINLLKMLRQWGPLTSVLFNGATVPCGPGQPHYWGFTIIHRHAILDRTPLDKWSARRRHFYLTTPTTFTRDRHPCVWRDSNTRSQQASGHWDWHPPQ